MGIAYQLTLAADVPLEQVAGLDRTGLPRLLSADLTVRRGYSVSILGGIDGDVDTDDDVAQGKWKPDRYVKVIFDMARNEPPERRPPWPGS
ncbi:SitI3 family protein [Micromonospora yangpuensis]|uniref:Uncharacterized protein n=1 Tax=Micromonospora yangpuensis TaxID=683228 RepID=A0A1C6U457_9ACTN|nr:SitI3 family protein [Micromonospora yangpuensis]GGL92920.1 hypothetical protein GCM10012279_08230 [Micromonospora yangpuensis]SCL48836.1 hypothetical protein GA0070617_0994 [Micromonospora yangpuensis]